MFPANVENWMNMLKCDMLGSGNIGVVFNNEQEEIGHKRKSLSGELKITTTYWISLFCSTFTTCPIRLTLLSDYLHTIKYLKTKVHILYQFQVTENCTYKNKLKVANCTN